MEEDRAFGGTTGNIFNIGHDGLTCNGDSFAHLPVFTATSTSLVAPCVPSHNRVWGGRHQESPARWEAFVLTKKVPPVQGGVGHLTAVFEEALVAQEVNGWLEVPIYHASTVSTCTMDLRVMVDRCKRMIVPTFTAYYTATTVSVTKASTEKCCPAIKGTLKVSE